jgi:hypothetical protein
VKVLLVAPRGTLSGLLPSVGAEISDIVNSGLDVDLMDGDVTASAVLRRVREYNYDVLWLATHGNAEHVELTGNEKISAEELVPLVRGRFQLVVLNTCNSLRIAKLVQLQANIGVICTLVHWKTGSGVDDKVAYQFGSNLSSALVKQPTITDAYLASVLGNDETYLYLPALRTNPVAIEGLTVKIDELNRKLTKELVIYRWALAVSLAMNMSQWIAIISLWRLVAGG